MAAKQKQLQFQFYFDLSLQVGMAKRQQGGAEAFKGN